MLLPFTRCPQSSKTTRNTAGASNSFPNNATLRDHLRSAHQHELGQLSDADLETQNIYLCRECDGDVFSRQCDLNAHVKKHHIEYRNRTNLEIVTDCIYDENCGPSHWPDALLFLRDFKWDAPRTDQP